MENDNILSRHFSCQVYPTNREINYSTYNVVINITITQYFDVLMLIRALENVNSCIFLVITAVLIINGTYNILFNRQDVISESQKTIRFT